MRAPELTRLEGRSPTRCAYCVLPSPARGQPARHMPQVAPTVQEEKQVVEEPHFRHLVDSLSMAQLLPAIVFVFSRKRCTSNALAFKAPLVTAEHRSRILGELNLLRESQPEAIPTDLEEPLLHGVACHHAGLLPGAPCSFGQSVSTLGSTEPDALVCLFAERPFVLCSVCSK